MVVVVMVVCTQVNLGAPPSLKEIGKQSHNYTQTSKGIK